MRSYFPRRFAFRNRAYFSTGVPSTPPVDPAAASIARFDLDAALWHSAQDRGVDCRQQTSVQSVSGAGPFLVKTSVGDFESRALINASGRWSNLTSAFSEGADSKSKWIGLKGHFAETSPLASVDLYFFDGGYCGVQPVDLADGVERSGRVNACAMVRADAGHHVAGSFRSPSSITGT